MTVDRRPSEREPLLLRHLALEPRDRIGQRVERRRQQPGVVVVPAVAVAQRDLAREVAGRGHLAHHVGDRGQRPGDRPRDREAEERRERDREHRRQRETGVDRVERLQLLGPRAEDQRDRTGLHAVVVVARRQRPRERLVFLRRRGIAREMPVARRRPASAGFDSAGSVDARICPSMPNATSLPVIFFSCSASVLSSRKPSAEGAEDLVARPIELDRHGNHLEDPVRLRQQAQAVAPGERVADGRLVCRDRRRARRSTDCVQQRSPTGS